MANVPHLCDLTVSFRPHPPSLPRPGGLSLLERYPSMRQLSLVALDHEALVELPERVLMRHHRRHAPTHTHAGSAAYASFGSAGNSNDTQQGNSNLQSLLNTGNLGR